MKCQYCGDEAIHFPVVDFFGETANLCAYCFHGVSMKKAVDIEGCRECEEALAKTRKVKV